MYLLVQYMYATREVAVDKRFLRRTITSIVGHLILVAICMNYSYRDGPALSLPGGDRNYGVIGQLVPARKGIRRPKAARLATIYYF